MSTVVPTGSPYQSFARIFTSYHDQYSEPGPSNHQIDSSIRYDAILDEQGGLLSSLMSAIEEEIRSKSSDSWDNGMDEGLTGGEKEALLLEHRTWQLLRSVFDNRLPREEAGFAPPSSQDVLHDNPYITPGDLIQLFVNEDAELSLLAVSQPHLTLNKGKADLQTLVDHLQSRPLLTSPPPLESRHGYLPATLRRAKAQQLSGDPGTGPRRPNSLDPDFTLREPQGTGLAGEDQTYQHPLLETLFDLVRHGELDQAVKVCEMGGEPWRGASLMGGRRWAMPGLTAGVDESSGEMALEGNRRRNLWKKACRSIARNPILSPSERSLYAALTSDLPTLLPACTTWEDHLWAHLQARVEARLDGRWRELGGFWEEESAALGSGEDEVRPSGGLEEIFGEMTDWQNDNISAASRNPYYVAQRMIMLGRTDALLSQFAGQLSGIEEKTSPELIGPLVRFFAHLILILRNLNQPVPDTPANAILQAYLQILEREGNDHLVAMYAACLREGSGEDSYARFLYSMDPAATKEARVEALSRAKTHNLDVAAIALETVRLTLEEAFAAIPALSKEQPDITMFTTGLTQRDVHLIRSIEWLTIIPETAEAAVVKANDVGRYFLSHALALGQANAAQALLKTLPPNLTAIVPNDQDDDYQLLEHEDVSRLFGVFMCHELVDEVLSRAPKATATKMEQHNWRKSLNNAIDRVHQATVELLTSDWLRFPLSTESENATQRLKELKRTRQIFIPDLILRLHNLLITHSTLFPQLIQTALDLTTIIAKEDNHVYEEFFSGQSGAAGAGRLVNYLERVREVGMMALRDGGSAFQVAVR